MSRCLALHQRWVQAHDGRTSRRITSPRVTTQLTVAAEPLQRRHVAHFLVRRLKQLLLRLQGKHRLTAEGKAVAVFRTAGTSCSCALRWNA